MLPGYGRFGGAGGITGGGGGPTDSFNVLLLGFEGSDGATTTSDESFANNGSPTFHNQAQIDTAQAKYGGSSLLLDGSDKIVFADDADWYFGTSDFTLEAFFRSANTSGFQTLFAQANTSGNGPFMIDVINGGVLRFRYDLSTDGQQNKQTNVSFSADTWYHIAMERSGTTLRFYFDGSTLTDITTTIGADRELTNSALDLTIGALTEAASGVTNGFNGWLDEIRFTKGLARYASDSGYTVPTSAFTR